MKKLLCFATIALALASASAEARDIGAIKRFVDAFPIPTYKLNGQGNGDVYLEAATTPPPSHISVDGWWSDKKMLLISFEAKPEEAYLILFSAVEMNDQSLWNQKMTVAGELRCGTAAATGKRPGTAIAGTNAFANPC